MAQHVIIPTIQGIWQEVLASFVNSLLWAPAITSKGSLHQEYLRLSDMKVSDNIFGSVRKQ